MRYNTHKQRIGIAELIFLLIGALLLVLLGTVAKGQGETRATKVSKAHAQIQQPLYSGPLESMVYGNIWTS